MPQHRIEYIVRGSWPFPLDMLRRDGSQPATEEDRRLVDLLSAECAPSLEAIREPVEIRLAITSDNPRARPMTARWESLGWSVPSDLDHEATKRLRAEQERRAELRRSAAAKLSAEERDALDLDEDGEPRFRP